MTQPLANGKSEESKLGPDAGADATLPRLTVTRLLESVVSISLSCADAAERRAAFLSALGEIIGADAGWWVWGRGWPEPGVLTPLAMVDFGLTDEKRTLLLQLGFDSKAMADFRAKVMARMDDSRRVTSDLSMYTPEEWAACATIRETLECGSWGSWIHSVRYGSAETWSHVFLLKGDAGPAFSEVDTRVVDVVMESVSWLHAAVDEPVPPGAFAGLTERQRTVLFLLLDGAARKKIASLLRISEDTVGDHIKAIYAQFGVSSSTELAALFLRSR